MIGTAIVVGSSTIAAVVMIAAGAVISLTGSHDGGSSADRAKFKDVRDAKDWRNPMVTILPHEVQIRSRTLAGDGIRIPVEQLRQQLVKLPVSDWPYGRVVLASDTGLRGLDDGGSIKRTHDAASEVLKALKIEADWWPPA